MVGSVGWAVRKKPAPPAMGLVQLIALPSMFTPMIGFHGWPMAGVNSRIFSEPASPVKVTWRSAPFLEPVTTGESARFETSASRENKTRRNIYVAETDN